MSKARPNPIGRGKRRSVTIARRFVTIAIRKLANELYPPADVQRPKTRAECLGGARPCPFVGCQYNLYLEVNPETGAIKLNHAQLEPWEMTESCALDIADRGASTLETVGDLLGLTRERTRQIETRTLVTSRKDHES